MVAPTIAISPYQAHNECNVRTPAVPTLACRASPTRSASVKDLYFDRRPINGHRERTLHAFATSVEPIGSRAASHFGPCGGCAHVHHPSPPFALAARREGCCLADVCSISHAFVSMCEMRARAHAFVHRGRVFPLENRSRARKLRSLYPSSAGNKRVVNISCENREWHGKGCKIVVENARHGRMSNFRSPI